MREDVPLAGRRHLGAVVIVSVAHVARLAADVAPDECVMVQNGCFPTFSQKKSVNVTNGLDFFDTFD